jgi:hypothetical protein
MVYRERTGAVTDTDLFTRLPRTLMKHGYLIERQEQHSRAFHFETQWKTRAPFPDEMEQGIESARTQLRIRALWDGRLYSLHFEAQNRVRGSNNQWHTQAPSPMTSQYLHEIATDLTLDLASGTKRY